MSHRSITQGESRANHEPYFSVSDTFEHGIGRLHHHLRPPREVGTTTIADDGAILLLEHGRRRVPGLATGMAKYDDPATWCQTPQPGIEGAAPDGIEDQVDSGTTRKLKNTGS